MNRLGVIGARLRMPLSGLGVTLLVADRVRPWWPLIIAGLVALGVGFAFYFRVGLLRGDPVTVSPPVRGRWVAVHSPADRVPSHGMLAYGQSYAIDLVHEPVDGARPAFRWWPLTRRPQDFPGFGQAVLAPAEGVVVRVHDRQRDHWSRTSPPALAYLVLEGVRELLGPPRILGNHVVIDLGDGVYAALAHLQRGSVRVSRGERVVAGQQIAACGNSGNSTEPHLHFQLMDHPSLLVAAGLPVAFDHFEIGGEVRGGMPGNGRPFQAEPGSALGDESAERGVRPDRGVRRV